MFWDRNHSGIFWKCNNCGLLYAIRLNAWHWYSPLFLTKVYIHELLDDNAHCCSHPKYITYTTDNQYTTIKDTQDFAHTITKRQLKEWVRWDLILRCRSNAKH